MNGLAHEEERSRRQLERLVSYQGRSRVREVLGVDEVTLTGLLDGGLDWPAGAREHFDRAWSVMEQLGVPAEESDEEDEAREPESGAPGEVDQPPEVEDRSLGSSGNEDPVAGASPPVVDAEFIAPFTSEELVHRRKAVAAVVAAEGVQDLLWTARYLVITGYLRPAGVSRHQRLSAWAVLLRLEIELINRFEYPLPLQWAKRVKWTGERRRWQTSLRVRRLEEVRRKQRRQHLRRLADWFLQRDEDREQLLLERVLDDARRRGTPDPLKLLSATPNWRQFHRMIPRGPQPIDP